MERVFVPLEKVESNTLDCREINVSLPVKISMALTEWNPQFVIYSSTEHPKKEANEICYKFKSALVSTTTEHTFSLTTAIADFNGDTKIDAMVVGHDKIDNFLVAILSEKGGRYKVFPLVSSDPKKHKCYSNAYKTMIPLPYIRSKQPPFMFLDLYKKGVVWEDMELYTDYEDDLYFRTDGVLIYDFPFGGRHLLKWDFRLDKKLIEILKNKEFYKEIEFLDYYIDGD
ncbi:MAG: hypothetical protein KA059_05070 [Elusimicrobiales bacterium]|nr:hypothetical protein [Elusimicrobiales bacterium]